MRRKLTPYLLLAPQIILSLLFIIWVKGANV